MSQIISMVAADLTRWVAWGEVQVKRVIAFNPNAGAVYIQLHQTPPLLTAGTLTAGQVPVVKSLYVPAGTTTQVSFEYTDPLTLSELTVGLSSTEANYTAVGAGAGLDMNLIVDSEYLVDSSTVLTGDLTTGVAALTVWSDASGQTARRRLFRADVKNNSGAVAYAFVTANPSLTTLATPIAGPFPMANGATINLSFGEGGLVPDLTTTAGVLVKGCRVVWSASPLATSANTPAAGTSVNIRTIHTTL